MFYLYEYLFYSHTFKCPGVLPVVGGAIGWQEVDMDPSCCLAIKLPLRCVKQCFRWVFVTLPLTGAVLWSIRLKGPWHQTERVVSRPNVRLPPRNCTTRRPPEKCTKKTTQVEPNYWIFPGRLGPRRDCSIWPEEDTPLKEMSPKSVFLLIAPRSHYCAATEWTPSYTHSQLPACIHKTHKRTYTHASLRIHTSPPSPSRPLQKADAIYMSWREVTGSNQPGE